MQGHQQHLFCAVYIHGALFRCQLSARHGVNHRWFGEALVLSVTYAFFHGPAGEAPKRTLFRHKLKKSGGVVSMSNGAILRLDALLLLELTHSWNS